MFAMVVFHQSCPPKAFFVQYFPNGNSPWWGTTTGNAMNQKGSIINMYLPFYTFCQWEDYGCKRVEHLAFLAMV
jgi:hypothetical protein